MVERRKELDRRYSRKKKMFKLKAKLAAAKTEEERNAILAKIRRISPWWEQQQAIRQKQLEQQAANQGK
jgi:hypothetical protein